MQRREVSARSYGPAPSGARFEAWVGGEESPEFLRQSKSLVASWCGTDVKAKYVEREHTNHFTVIDDLGDPASEMTRALARLCK